MAGWAIGDQNYSSIANMTLANSIAQGQAAQRQAQAAAAQQMFTNSLDASKQTDTANYQTGQLQNTANANKNVAAGQLLDYWGKIGAAAQAGQYDSAKALLGQFSQVAQHYGPEGARSLIDGATKLIYGANSVLTGGIPGTGAPPGTAPSPQGASPSAGSPPSVAGAPSSASPLANMTLAQASAGGVPAKGIGLSIPKFGDVGTRTLADYQPTAAPPAFAGMGGNTQPAPQSDMARFLATPPATAPPLSAGLSAYPGAPSPAPAPAPAVPSVVQAAKAGAAAQAPPGSLQSYNTGGPLDSMIGASWKPSAADQADIDSKKIANDALSFKLQTDKNDASSFPTFNKGVSQFGTIPQQADAVRNWDTQHPNDQYKIPGQTYTGTDGKPYTQDLYRLNMLDAANLHKTGEESNELAARAGLQGAQTGLAKAQTKEVPADSSAKRALDYAMAKEHAATTTNLGATLPTIGPDAAAKRALELAQAAAAGGGAAGGVDKEGNQILAQLSTLHGKMSGMLTYKDITGKIKYADPSTLAGDALATYNNYKDQIASLNKQYLQHQQGQPQPTSGPVNPVGQGFAVTPAPTYKGQPVKFPSAPPIPGGGNASQSSARARLNAILGLK